MPRLTRITATALSLAAVAPAVAFGAAGLDLQGAASLRQTGDKTAEVTFAVDDAIAGKRKGVAQLGSVDRATIRPDGRHGDDYAYKAVFEGDELYAGERYVVRIEATGHADKRLRLKLIDKR